VNYSCPDCGNRILPEILGRFTENHEIYCEYCGRQITSRDLKPETTIPTNQIHSGQSENLSNFSQTQIQQPQAINHETDNISYTQNPPHKRKTPLILWPFKGFYLFFKYLAKGLYYLMKYVVVGTFLACYTPFWIIFRILGIKLPYPKLGKKKLQKENNLQTPQSQIYIANPINQAEETHIHASQTYYQLPQKNQVKIPPTEQTVAVPQQLNETVSQQIAETNPQEKLQDDRDSYFDSESGKRIQTESLQGRHFTAFNPEIRAGLLKLNVNPKQLDEIAEMFVFLNDQQRSEMLQFIENPTDERALSIVAPILDQIKDLPIPKKQKEALFAHLGVKSDGNEDDLKLKLPNIPSHPEIASNKSEAPQPSVKQEKEKKSMKAKNQASDQLIKASMVAQRDVTPEPEKVELNIPPKKESKKKEPPKRQKIMM
jgi:DNA-directed RNA polymerase subunit RPC12/RpoP